MSNGGDDCECIGVGEWVLCFDVCGGKYERFVYWHYLYRHLFDIRKDSLSCLKPAFPLNCIRHFAKIND